MECSVDRLKGQLKTGELDRLYIFHGEESYLREFYLKELQRVLLPEGLEDFNLDILPGEKLALSALFSAADSVPMMAERRLVIVNDFNVYAPGSGAEKGLLEFLEELPESVVLVFNFGSLAHKPDGRSKTTQAVRKLAQIVEFPYLKENQLIPWVTKYFQKNGKSIDYRAAERLIFLCGNQMQALRNEVGKLTAYVEGGSVTIGDVDALVTADPEARVFDFVRLAAGGAQRKAALLLREIMETDEPHVRILSILSNQMLQLYTARLLLENRKTAARLASLFGMKSEYQAKQLFETARKQNLPWLRNALNCCYQCDLNLKGRPGKERALELLLAQLFAYQPAR